ncbi:ATP-binding protein [Mesonia maritima]|uniref:NadR type nicotinamide-nucleotide adenylyltransferase n=1 Tax=Mesonia maritima TaxID=1793873 RepID=A0ABU1K4T7_9FLAO|nr:ATP-binding protein [Mesonia maritima]MDR6299537.1 NadR type nicotinamide-nucleotide adenylyltransferase [Mesonia maritima]
MEKTLEQKPADCLKIVLFGPESTGKTSLAKKLAEHYQTNWVPEFAREYLQKKYDECNEICAQEDLIPIAKGQISAENKLSKTANKVLFCDTNVLQTYAYGKVYYKNFENETLKKYIGKHKYNLYLLTYIDVPWEEDDLRDKPHEREEMFVHFKEILKQKNLPYVIINGTLEERLKKAVNVIDKLLKNENA